MGAISNRGVAWLAQVEKNKIALRKKVSAEQRTLRQKQREEKEHVDVDQGDLSDDEETKVLMAQLASLKVTPPAPLLTGCFALSTFCFSRRKLTSWSLAGRQKWVRMR